MINKWLTVGIGVKRWLVVLTTGIMCLSAAIALTINKLGISQITGYVDDVSWLMIVLLVVVGIALSAGGLLKALGNLLAPYRRHQQGSVIDVVYAHSKRHKGLKVVAVGGGTGLPSVLRGFKAITSNITAIVTVADDGGSSGQLRRDLGVPPPGDIRNNIAALADDESLMTQLFQYRFGNGELGGHSFGNLFIAALSGVSGGLETALTEVERVLNIQGRVLPSTIQDVNLIASVRLPGKSSLMRIHGESKISQVNGQIRELSLVPADIKAYSESVRTILDADLVVIGPGSLYTSILPNLLIKGITAALRETTATKVYVCNVATQPGETEDYNVADHVLALEAHIGRGVFQTILANNATPTENAGSNTRYVRIIPEGHEVLSRYVVRYTDLTDAERPWRHDPQKLAGALMNIVEFERTGGNIAYQPVLHVIT